MKIPFTLDAWLKDKSQKIETAFGEPAKVVFTEGLGECPILAVIYDGDTTDSAWFTKDGRSQDGVYGLFIVTPEEELSEFEKAIKDLVLAIDEGELQELGVFEEENLGAWAIKKARELLALARDQFIKDGYVIEKKAFHDTVEKVAPEVMKEISDKVDMEEDLRLEYERGKAETLKDLPRWIPNKFDKHNFETCKAYLDTPRYLCYQDKMIDVSELVEKLPGFKED